MRWNDLIDLRVGQYQIIEELGRGGAARVFRATDEAHSRPVAFKVLPIETDDRQSFMQRFMREVDVIRTLRHPNIVEVYDAGETEEFVYLVLHLLEGGTLRQRIASRRMSPQEVCQYMVQIALALHHAHQMGIVHRDVKPSNMLLDADQPGRILLADFGTAKILNARGLTRTGATVGTPEYMSPEQAEGREVDQRSDIYSLGCTLYEALAGRPPFVGATPVSVLYQQVHAQPTYIRSINAEAPRELWTVLRTCLAKRPDDRYGSAELLAEKLQPFAEGLIQPTPAPWNSPVSGYLGSGGLAGPDSRRLRGSTSAPLTEQSAFLPTPMTPDSLSAFGGFSGIGVQGSGPVGPIPLNLEGAPAPHSRPTLRPRSPRQTMGLPTTTGGPGLLSGSGSLTPAARQAMSAFEAQLDAEERQAPALPKPPRLTQGPAPTSAPLVDLYPTAPLEDLYPHAPPPAPLQRAPTSGPRRSVPSGPVDAQQWRGQVDEPYRGPASGVFGEPQRAPTSGPYRAPTSGPYRAPTSGPYRGPASGAVRRQTSIPVDVGLLRAGIDRTTIGRRPVKRRRRSPALVGAVALMVLVVGVALSLGGIKLLAKQGAPAKATPRPTMTATLRPTATATVAQATATATPDPQIALNHQAASAFRAITIASFTDGSCSSGSMATTFYGGPVYVNLCMANAKAPGPVTVVVRQNGAIVRTLISNLYPSAGASYSQGHTLGSGSYDMLVTMKINGKQAVAQDIRFTVR